MKTYQDFYRENRAEGITAKPALEIARLQALIYEKTEDSSDYDIELISEDENVRLKFVQDEYVCYEDLAGDTYNVEYNADSVPGGERTILAQEKAFKALIDNEGVWGFVIEKKCPQCNQWEHYESCWGFVGEIPEIEYIHSLASALQ
jgi:hypothetical protein